MQAPKEQRKQEQSSDGSANGTENKKEENKSEGKNEENSAENKKEEDNSENITEIKEEPLTFFYKTVKLDETEQELIHVYLDKGESRSWIAKKIHCKESLIQAYIDAVRDEKIDKEKRRLEKIRLEKKEKQRIDDEKRAAHKGTYWIGDKVLADYYGIGTYFKAVVQSKDQTTGLYQLTYPDSGARQELPSPKLRKSRSDFTEGDRLDEEDEEFVELEKERKEQEKKEAEEKKKKAAEEKNKVPGEDEDTAMICDNCNVGDAKTSCAECSKVYCNSCDTLLHEDQEMRSHKRMTLAEVEERARKKKEEEEKKKVEKELIEQKKRAEDHHRDTVAETYAQEKKDAEVKNRMAASRGRGSCNVGKCNCKMFEVNEKEPLMCDRCWHTEKDHLSVEKAYFRVGDLVSYSSLQGWKNGTITMVFPDGKFQIMAEDHSPVPRMEQGQIRARKAKFQCGDKVEYSTMKGWIDARIYEHNRNGTYQLRLEDNETIIPRQSEGNIRKRERGMKWKCSICNYVNKVSSMRCDICLAKKPLCPPPDARQKVLTAAEKRKVEYQKRKKEEREKAKATKEGNKPVEQKKQETDKKKEATKKKKAQLSIFLQKTIANKLRLSKKDTYWDLSNKGITDNDCIMIGFYLTQTKSGCPGKHTLTTFKTPTGSWFCSVCEGPNLAVGTRMFGCRLCDWDCCRNCFMINCRLTRLDLNGNKIGDRGAHAIGRALKTNTTLKVLRMEDTNIGDAGAQSIGRGLKRNYTLRILALAKNQISDNGSWVIGKSLKMNGTLESLDLEHNNVGDLGAEGFGVAFQNNNTLTSLNLNHNNIGEIGSQCMGIALGSNTALKELRLSKNQIWDIGAEHIGQGLATCGLEILHLDGNFIGSEGAQKLADGIRKNKTLKELHLKSNSLSENGKSALSNAKSNHPTLKDLTMDATLEIDKSSLNFRSFNKKRQEEELEKDEPRRK